MNYTLEEETKQNEITKQWLRNHPYDPTKDLPKGWEYRFNMRGRFMKYDSVEHAERKNKFVEDGYCSRAWKELKANLQPNDEIWIHGGSGGVAIYLIRDGQIIEDDCGKWKYPRRGHYVNLSCY
jgi:hypothetical protein